MDFRTAYPPPPFPTPKKPVLGETQVMDAMPDHGEENYKVVDVWRARRP